MRQLWHKLKNVRWMEFSGLLVGAALMAIFIIMATVAFYAMKVQAVGLFRQEEYRLSCLFDNGLGLRVGTKVLVNGVEVGRVSELKLTDDSRVMLTLSIKKKFDRWITSDAIVSATRDQNLISERILNIVQPANLPIDPNKVLKDGEALNKGRTEDLETVVVKAIELIDKVETIAHNTGTLLNMALDTNSSIGALIGSRKLYDQLIYQVDKVDMITTHTQGILSSVDERLPPLLDRTDTLIGQVSAIGGKLNVISTQAMGLLSSVDTTIYTMNLIMGDLQTLTRGASVMLVDAESKLEHADDLMTGLSSYWFIRNRIPKKDTVPVMGDEQW